MDLTFPANVEKYLRETMKLIQLQGAKDWMLEQVKSLKTHEDFVLISSGTLFAFVGVFTMLVLVCKALKPCINKLSEKNKYFKTVVQMMTQKLFYNSILRSMISAYLPLCITCFYSLQKIIKPKDGEEGSSAMNTTFTIGILILVLVFP